jgi:hypothetical protein
MYKKNKKSIIITYIYIVLTLIIQIMNLYDMELNKQISFLNVIVHSEIFFLVVCVLGWMGGG